MGWYLHIAQLWVQDILDISINMMIWLIEFYVSYIPYCLKAHMMNGKFTLIDLKVVP